MTGGRVLAIDTSGTSALVALGDADGTLLTERRWPAGYRHGEELLTHVDEMLTASGTALADLGGIVVGTGPGAFTGLRVGLATAKALARGLNIPIAGVPSSEALLRAASLAGAFEVTRAVLLLPAGPSDRVVVAAGQVPAGEAPAGEAPAGEAPAGEVPAGEAPAGEAPAGEARLLRGGEEPEIEAGAVLVAVDLPDRAPAAALALGAQAESGLSAALVRLGVEKLAAGGDDVARLVPEYVSLPRGVPVLKGEVRWSRDHR
jgi:tRNA threonylcarbamoyl adenosine modification protein YeaZ